MRAARRTRARVHAAEGGVVRAGSYRGHMLTLDEPQSSPHLAAGFSAAAAPTRRRPACSPPSARRKAQQLTCNLGVGGQAQLEDWQVAGDGTTALIELGAQ